MDAVKAQSRVARDDGLQALRAVRERASAWGVDPGRVGMTGFSAGGLLTIHAATGYDAATRPAFAAPIYGGVFDEYTVPSMDAHGSARLSGRRELQPERLVRLDARR
ncbi:alpha/beta hydrolase [Nonomuraea sp. LPB2021202275-12-8]|uniref:alpha/beta hydrolase n=1 Tax=Nonomuraea sp. LPB2021202275-12-8 TaxID=3120159 RepID=UPI00300D2C1D